MMLAAYAQGRDNNFNLLRVLAALAVLITHSFALATGSPKSEPFRETLGITIGMIAVDVFFVASGYLVTSSLLTRQTLIDFVCARVLRIYPALVVMVCGCVFILGPWFTALSLSEYLHTRQTYGYLISCSTLIRGVGIALPGVFADNPLPLRVNGSLWTMPYEIRMYTALALVWLVFKVAPQHRVRLFKVSVTLLAVVAVGCLFIDHFRLAEGEREKRLMFMFFAGASYYVLRSRVPLTPGLFWMCLASLVISAGNKEVFFIVYSCVIAYLVLFIAYVPSGLIRKYNQVGDYSYGIYIYAWPVQQSIVALIPGVSILQLCLFSGVVTSVLAALSWHLLEQRVLALKNDISEHVRSQVSMMSLMLLRRP